MLSSVVPRLCYDVMTYVQEVTVPRPGSKVTGEEGQSCFGMVQSNWAKFEGALSQIIRQSSPHAATVKTSRSI